MSTPPTDNETDLFDIDPDTWLSGQRSPDVNNAVDAEQDIRFYDDQHVEPDNYPTTVMDDGRTSYFPDEFFETNATSLHNFLGGIGQPELRDDGDGYAGHQMPSMPTVEETPLQQPADDFAPLQPQDDMLQPIGHTNEFAEVRWTGEVNSLQDAQEYLDSLEDPLRTPAIPNDDARSIFEHEMPSYAIAILHAIVHLPAPAPQELDKNRKEYYERQQRAARSKIEDTFSTHQGRKIAESRAFLLVNAAVECHLVGMPLKDFAAAAAPKGSCKSETAITCSTRLWRMIDCIEQNKLVALDVLHGEYFVNIARAANAHLAKKLTNVKSNGRKKLKGVEERSKEGERADAVHDEPVIDDTLHAVPMPKRGKKGEEKKAASMMQGPEVEPPSRRKKRSAGEMDEGNKDPSFGGRSVRVRFDEITFMPEQNRELDMPLYPELQEPCNLPSYFEPRPDEDEEARMWAEWPLGGDAPSG